MLYKLANVLKTASGKTAVIIMGNPKHITGQPSAKKFYADVKQFLVRLGYQVTLDQGKPYTSPKPADLWIGHSRGGDRLRFAPPETKAIAFGYPRRGNETFPVVNHPKDDLRMKRWLKGEDADPGIEHYTFTPEMKRALLKLHE